MDSERTKSARFESHRVDQFGTNAGCQRGLPTGGELLFNKAARLQQLHYPVEFAAIILAAKRSISRNHPPGRQTPPSEVAQRLRLRLKAAPFVVRTLSSALCPLHFVSCLGLRKNEDRDNVWRTM